MVGPSTRIIYKRTKTHVVEYRGMPVKTIRGELCEAAKHAGVPFGRAVDGATFHIRATVRTAGACVTAPATPPLQIATSRELRRTGRCACALAGSRRGDVARSDALLEWPRTPSRMFIVLNGPLGIGKSTLAEALCESIDQCVMLDGDHVVATNPVHPDSLTHLHSTLALLVTHHRRFGYRHFVIDHIWQTPAELADLRRHLNAVDSAGEVRCFLLTLPLDENLERIRRRQSTRAIDEQEFELRTVEEERDALSKYPAGDLGEPLDCSATPDELVATITRRLGLG